MSTPYEQLRRASLFYPLHRANLYYQFHSTNLYYRPRKANLYWPIFNFGSTKQIFILAAPQRKSLLSAPQREAASLHFMAKRMPRVPAGRCATFLLCSHFLSYLYHRRLCRVALSATTGHQAITKKEASASGLKRGCGGQIKTKPRAKVLRPKPLAVLRPRFIREKKQPPPKGIAMDCVREGEGKSRK